MLENNTDVRRIGENVRAARRASGQSLETIAGLVGRSKGWLSKVENGKTPLERRSDIAALAEALQVSADFLLSGPAPEVQRERRTYNLLAMQRVLLDASPTDPPDVRARPLEVLRAEVDQADAALRAADYPTVARLLPTAIGELYVHCAGAEPDRSEALKLVVRAVGSDATCMLRHLDEVHLAWIAGERAQLAADLLGDPIWRGAAAYCRAHARSSANKPRALLLTPQIADEVEPYIGDDPFAHQVYGMLRLSSALACQVTGDKQGTTSHAAEAARLARPLGEDPDAWELFGPANVGVWRTSLAVEVNEPTAALEHASKVEPRALASANRRAALQIEKARAHALLSHSPAVVVRELRQAERLSPQQVRNHPLVRELVADMLYRAGGRDLRGLAWRMNLI